MQIIEVTLSEHFSQSDLKELSQLSNTNFQIKPKYTNMYPTSGGIGWEGIVIFTTVAIFTGFLESLGVDAYNKLKEVLFSKKQKLKKGKERFTLNIILDKPGIVFFDLTNLECDDFNRAFDKIKEEITYVPSFKSKGIDFFYDLKGKKWKLKQNKSLEI